MLIVAKGHFLYCIHLSSISAALWSFVAFLRPCCSVIQINYWGSWNSVLHNETYFYYFLWYYGSKIKVLLLNCASLWKYERNYVNIASMVLCSFFYLIFLFWLVNIPMYVTVWFFVGRQTSDPKSGFATVEKDLPGGLTPMLGDRKVIQGVFKLLWYIFQMFIYFFNYFR